MSIDTPNFEEMDIGQLRAYASHLRLPLAKTAKKVEIIDALKRKLDGRVIPEMVTATSQVKPGYAKIRLLEDPTPGAGNMPVYVNANGYVATIPRGVEVIVPMRVVRTLNDATVLKRKQAIVADANGRESFKETTVQAPSYPFQILEMVPGPEVLTAHEKNKQKIQGPRMQYRDKFGHWPRPGDLRRAIEKGLVKLHEEDALDAYESEALLKSEDEA
jgi:hypothetical protein